MSRSFLTRLKSGLIYKKQWIRFIRSPISTAWYRNFREMLNSKLAADIKSYFFYGNTLEYSANITGKKNHQESKNAFKSTYDKTFHKTYWKKGYYIVGHIFDSALISRIQQEYSHAIADPKLSGEIFVDDSQLRDNYNYGGYAGSVKGMRRDIHDVQKAIPSAAKLLENDAFKKLIIDIYGSNFKLDSMCSWRICHVPKECSEKFEVGTNRFHFDDHYSDILKVFINLSDVAEEDGPFQFFPRPFSKKLLWDGFKKELRSISITGGLSPAILNFPQLIKHIGSAGAVAICSTPFCLHRAGEPSPGHMRDILQLTLRPSC